MFSKILIAVDGSAYADKALEAAADLQQKYAAELHLVFAVNYQHYVMGLGAGAAMMIPYDELETGAKTLLEDRVSKLEKMGCTTTEMHVVDGDPGRTITELAKSMDADLIVCGCKGHSDVGSILLGSVSHKLSHLAHCPCLLVR